MDYVVLDTDVASRIIQERLTGPLVGRLAGPVWAVTFVTAGELWKWAELRSWGPHRRRRLELWLNRVIVVQSSLGVSRGGAERSPPPSAAAGLSRSTTPGSPPAA